MTERKAFKVVRPAGRGLYESATAPWTVQYAPGRFVTAPVGALLCFETLFQGFTFSMASGEDLEIWSCTALEPCVLPERAIGSSNVSWSALERLWGLIDPQKLVEHFGDMLLLPWPDGTIAYRYVRLDRPCYSPRYERDNTPVPEPEAEDVRELARRFCENYSMAHLVPFMGSNLAKITFDGFEAMSIAGHRVRLSDLSLLTKCCYLLFDAELMKKAMKVLEKMAR